MSGRIAVITMTRDRLEYTDVCFKSLREKAGCEYDHYVLDNGSTDGTQDWLLTNARGFKRIMICNENLGLVKGFNALLSMLDGIYDVVVKIDNDCLLLTDGTLEIIIREMKRFGYGVTISPRVLGLNHPPKTIGQTQNNGFLFSEVYHFGGIFYPIPWVLAKPITGKAFVAHGLDSKLSERMRENGLKLYYMENMKVEHIEGTDNQAKRFPEYFERKYTEEKTVMVAQ